MDIIFYNNFHKRRNSFLLPDSSTESVTWEGSLKEPSSVTNPEIRLRGGTNTSNPRTNTYAYIADFGRYYFINDWTWEAGFWVADMSCDVLASGRDVILSQTAFVSYSASSYNTQLIDSRLSTESLMAVSTVDGEILTGLSYSASTTGCFVVNVISSQGVGGVATYRLTATQLSNLISVLSIEDATEFLDQIEQLFAGASANAILSCVWIPFIVSAGAGAIGGNTVYIGNYDTGVSGTLISTCDFTSSTSLTIPWPYTDWRRSSQFMSALLFLPYLGVVSLPMDRLMRCTSISASLTIDYATGGATYVVNGTGAGALLIESFNLGCNIPISSMSVDPYGAVKESVSAVSSIAKLNISSAISSAFEAVEELAFPETTVSGAFGQSKSNASTYVNYGNDSLVRLWLYYREFSDSPADLASTIGRPYKAVTSLSSLSGYAQTVNFSSRWGYAGEKEAVNALMDGGVYIE